MHFGEYELSPSLISLSPLPSAHPEAFQRLLVRSSSQCYLTFNLAKGRSLGFASTNSDYTPLKTRFRYGYYTEYINLAGTSNSQVHYAKGTLSHSKVLQPLVSAWFQGLFHSSIRSSFHLSLTVLVHYRSLGSIQPYRMVPADSYRISRVPHYSGYHQSKNSFLYGIITLYDYTFQYILVTILCPKSWSYNPNIAVTTLVWANPRSLATTRGIIIYFLFLQVLRCFSSLR